MRDRMYKTAAVLALIILITIFAAGCGAAQLVKPTTTDATKIVKVTGSFECKIENGKALLHCTTDMMDGAIFRLSLTDTLGKELASTVISKSGDNLKAEFDLSHITEKDIYAFAVCAPEIYGAQPDGVKIKYGTKFENIDSPDIIWNNDGVILKFISGPINLAG